jgi:hypothetical protein
MQHQIMAPDDWDSWLCHAYRLMANHYQLLVETSQATLGLG